MQLPRKMSVVSTKQCLGLCRDSIVHDSLTHADRVGSDQLGEDAVDPGSSFLCPLCYAQIE